MTKKPKIALFVGDHTRDLPGLVLLAWELCRRGATCYLVPYRKGQEEVWALAPDFVLLNVMRPNQVRQTRQFIEAGIQFGLLDTEGVVWSSMDEYTQTLWEDWELSHMANCICLWGPKVAEHTLSAGAFTKEQSFVTGSPRFDFYVEPLSSVYKNLENAASGKRKSVLLNTNFTIANAGHLPYPEVIDAHVDTYGYSREETLGWYKNGLQAIDSMSDLANNLANDFPEIDVIVRPHQEERIATYKEKLSQKSNIKLTNAGYVAPWILSAVAVIQRSCTTAVEAALAGIPAFSPQWIPAACYYPIPESVSDPIVNYDDLRSSLRALLDGKYVVPNGIKGRIGSVTEDWFNRIDGRAYQRVADAILDSLSAETEPDKRLCRRFLYRIPSPGSNLKANPGDRIRHFLNLPSRFAFREMRSFYNTKMDDRFNEKSVAELAKRISGALGGHEVRITRANDSGAYLQPRYRGRTIIMETC